MQRTILMTAVSLGLALANVPAALAQAQDYPPEVILAYMDVDKDGKVTLNDYLNVQLPNLTKFDADGDGMLNPKEFRESLATRSAKENADRSFENFDTETPRRKLTQREFLGYHAFIFTKFLDTDRDGTLSLKEFTKIARQN